MCVGAGGWGVCVCVFMKRVKYHFHLLGEGGEEGEEVIKHRENR